MTDTLLPVDPRARGRRLGVILLGGSVLLLVVGTVGAWNPLSLVWVERLFHHTFVFGVLAALGFSFGLAMLLRSRVLQVLMCAGGLTVAVGWAVLGALAHWLFHEPVIATIPAPAGDGSSYELVVRESADDVIDPAWMLSVGQTDSLLGREWRFGCMSGDAPWNSYKSAAWASREKLVIQSVGKGSTTVIVNPKTGEPGDPKGNPWTCIGWN